MIDKAMKIDDVLRDFPLTRPVFRSFGIDCEDCQLKEYEDLEHGAKVHGIDLGEFIRRLNEAVSGR